MSLETLTHKVGSFTDRRAFLAKLGAAGLASAAYLGGVATPSAEALCSRHGCDFCVCPNSSFCGGGNWCVWCWWGGCGRHNGAHANPRQHQCCEGYILGGNCNGGCGSGWNCSFYGDSRGC